MQLLTIEELLEGKGKKHPKKFKLIHYPCAQGLMFKIKGQTRRPNLCPRGERIREEKRRVWPISKTQSA